MIIVLFLDDCILFIFQLYYDNSSASHDFLAPVPPVGFTHVYTPNDFKITNDEAMEQFSLGFLRLFEQIRDNPKSELFAQFEKPSTLKYLVGFVMFYILVF